MNRNQQSIIDGLESLRAGSPREQKQAAITERLCLHLVEAAVGGARIRAVEAAKKSREKIPK
jgi:hypothetical protein